MKISVVALAVALGCVAAAGAATPGYVELGTPDGTFFKGDRWFVYVLESKTLPLGLARDAATLGRELAKLTDADLRPGVDDERHMPGAWTLRSGQGDGVGAALRKGAWDHGQYGFYAQHQIGGLTVRAYEVSSASETGIKVFAIFDASLPELQAAYRRWSKRLAAGPVGGGEAIAFEALSVGLLGMD